MPPNACREAEELRQNIGTNYIGIFFFRNGKENLGKGFWIPGKLGVAMHFL